MVPTAVFNNICWLLVPTDSPNTLYKSQVKETKVFIFCHKKTFCQKRRALALTGIYIVGISDISVNGLVMKCKIPRFYIWSELMFNLGSAVPGFGILNNSCFLRCWFREVLQQVKICLQCSVNWLSISLQTTLLLEKLVLPKNVILKFLSQQMLLLDKLWVILWNLQRNIPWINLNRKQVNVCSKTVTWQADTNYISRHTRTCFSKQTSYTANPTILLGNRRHDTINHINILQHGLKLIEF